MWAFNGVYTVNEAVCGALHAADGHAPETAIITWYMNGYNISLYHKRILVCMYIGVPPLVDN